MGLYPASTSAMTNSNEDDPSGFKDDAKALDQSQIKQIQLGEQLSPSMIRISIVRGKYLRGTPASIELRNLAKYDMDDDEYDEETGVIDYQALSPELRERTDALIEHSLRISEYTEIDDDGEESDDELRRRDGRY